MGVRYTLYVAAFFAMMLAFGSVTAQEEPLFKREDYIIFKDLNVNWSEDPKAVQPEVVESQSLFPLFTDNYGEVLKFYRNPIEVNRRALESWMVSELYDVLPTSVQLEPFAPTHWLRVAGSMEGYNLGVAARYASQFSDSDMLSASLDMRTGRDLFVDGLYSTQLRGRAEWIHIFGGDNDHYLSTSLYAPYINGSRRNSVGDEAVGLTSNNLYNSAWGYYNGEVRSSKIDTYAVPSLESRYQRSLSSATTFAAELTGRYGVSSRSQLGWYDAFNPYPDYYRNLPSYIQNSSNSTIVEQAWRSNDESYTQIDWDQLVWSNYLSTDGESHYVMESRVRRIAEFDLSTVARSQLESGFAIRYGASGGYSSTRNYKQLDDLLGGDYLLNNDQYIGDYEQLDIDMDNDLRNPNRRVVVGERFGYDYTLNTLKYSLVLALEYLRDGISIEVNGEFGSSSTQRVGHYEKERFAGYLSYGPSSVVSLSTTRFDYRCAYQIDKRSEILFAGLYTQLPPLEYQLFLQPEYANLSISNPSCSSLNSLSMRYQYSRVGLQFSGEVFYYQTRDGTDIVRYYDDLSYTYTNAVVSGVATRGVGVELALTAQLTNTLRLESTLSLGEYCYTDAPTVSLYDDVDLSLYSVSQASAIEGCALPESASLFSTLELSYMSSGGWIISTRFAFAAGRYVEPSYVRRTDRVVSSLLSSGLADEAITQDTLSNMYDLSLSIVRTLYLRGGDRLSIMARVDNLLGINDLQQWGGESNRAYYTSGGSTTGLRYLQSNSYLYSLPRRLYLSVSYSF